MDYDLQLSTISFRSSLQQKIRNSSYAEHCWRSVTPPAIDQRFRPRVFYPRGLFHFCLREPAGS
jgi:hypothetical protein